MYQVIVVGTDGSETAGVALSHAVALAKVSGLLSVDVEAVNAASARPVRPSVGTARRRRETRAWRSRPTPDLFVIGNRGMSGARRFILGSVPNKVSHHRPCSLLIVDTTT